MSKKVFRVGRLFLLSMALLMAGCGREDEILPAPPQQEEKTDPLPESELPQEDAPSLNLSSDLYQYGDFAGMPYRILIPRNFDSTRTYPLHIFLHGQGERGIDNEQQLEVGASFFQEDSIRQRYPAFVVLPQCPKTQNWFDDWATEKLKRLIDDLATRYPINDKRISIGGFSMGAFGTFAMVARYPVFQAAVAISGAAEDKNAVLMRGAKWRIFAGRNDRVVSSTESKRIAVALEEAGASVIFTLYSQADHNNTWIKAFSEPDFFYWLFAEKPQL